MKDIFETARQSFFSGANGDAAASPSHTFTQVKTYDGPVVERGTALKSAVSGKTELVPCR
jgi:hypothetical protein